MSVKLEMSGYRRLAGSAVSGYVKVICDGALLFADSVTLSSLKSRADFIRELQGRLNGGTPEGFDFERELLRLLTAAEETLKHDPAPSAPSEAEDEQRVDDYARRAGRYEAVRIKETPAGPLETRLPLSNFTAEIVEDLVVDDGAETRRYFQIAGELGGRPLPTVRVQADQFPSLAWVVDKWGIAARVRPGQSRRDLLRDCIQAFSRDACRRTTFGHTGWRRLDGCLVYLHSNGALGTGGAIPDLEVELEGKLANYRLPDPPEGAALADAVRASWALWQVAQPGIAAAVQGVIYGAPSPSGSAPTLAFGCGASLAASRPATPPWDSPTSGPSIPRRPRPTGRQRPTAWRSRAS